MRVFMLKIFLRLMISFIILCQHYFDSLIVFVIEIVYSKMSFTLHSVDHAIECILARVMQKIVALQLRENSNINRWSHGLFNNVFSSQGQRQQPISPTDRISEDHEPIHPNFKVSAKLVRSFHRLNQNFSRNPSRENERKILSLPSKVELRCDQNLQINANKNDGRFNQNLKLKKNKSLKPLRYLQRQCDEAMSQKTSFGPSKHSYQSAEVKQNSKQKEWIKPSSLEYKIGLQRKFKLQYLRPPILRLVINKVESEGPEQNKNEHLKPARKKLFSLNPHKQNRPMNQIIWSKSRGNLHLLEERKLTVSKFDRNRKNLIHVYNRDKADELFLEACLQNVLHQQNDQQSVHLIH